jgi:GcrA cell cycle regulator
MSNSQASLPWDGAQVETLKTLWLAGQSARSIAETLGVTRNAVLGKVHRLQMGERSVPLPSDTTARHKPAKLSPSGIRPARELRLAKDLRPAQGSGRGNPGLPKSIAIKARAEQRASEVVGDADLRVLRSKAWQRLEGTNPKPLEALGAAECKWPVGDAPILFCGADRGGHHADCLAHQNLARGAKC